MRAPQKNGCYLRLCWHFSVICSVCFASLGVHASPPDINAFLLAAREGVEVLDVEESWRGMASLKPASMPLEDVELRMEFDNGGVSEGDYVVRLHPRSFSRMQAETQQWRARETMLEARYRSLLSEALRERYRQLLEMMRLSRERDLQERRITLLKERISAYQSLSESQEFRFAKLLESDQDLAQARLQQMRLQRALKTQQEALRQQGVSIEEKLDDSWLKSVAGVMQAIDEMPQLDEAAQANPLLTSKLSAVQVAETQLTKQRAKQGLQFSFFDLGYDAAKENSRSYSIGLGIKIPLGTAADPGLAEARTRLNSARREQQLLQQELPQQLHMVRVELQELQQAYGLVMDRLQKLDGIGDDLASSLMIYRIFEDRLQWKLEEAKIRQQILERYVDLLHLSGQLARPPLKNHLSKQDDQL